METLRSIGLDRWSTFNGDLQHPGRLRVLRIFAGWLALCSGLGDLGDVFLLERQKRRFAAVGRPAVVRCWVGGAVVRSSYWWVTDVYMVREIFTCNGAGCSCRSGDSSNNQWVVSILDRRADFIAAVVQQVISKLELKQCKC